MTESTPGERGQLEGRNERTLEYAEHFNMTPVEPVKTDDHTERKNYLTEVYAEALVIDFVALGEEAQKLKAALRMPGISKVQFTLPPNISEEGRKQIESYLKSVLGDDFERVIFQG